MMSNIIKISNVVDKMIEIDSIVSNINEIIDSIREFAFTVVSEIYVTLKKLEGEIEFDVEPTEIILVDEVPQRIVVTYVKIVGTEILLFTKRDNVRRITFDPRLRYFTESFITCMINIDKIIKIIDRAIDVSDVNSNTEVLERIKDILLTLK